MIPVNISPANAAIGNDVKILQDIHLKTKNLAIYQRDIKLFTENIPHTVKQPILCKVNGTTEEITFSLNRYFASELPGFHTFLEDVLSVLAIFKQVTKVASFRVLLATVNTNMCSRFHADNNELRMLCAYAGPGTLWLPDIVVDREAYLTGKGNRDIVRDESLIQQVGTGDVVILKGALYPEATPILHRSPGIEKRSEERILLSIDINEPLNFPI